MKSKTPALTLSAVAVLTLGMLSSAMAVDRSDLVHDAHRLEASTDALMEVYINDLVDRHNLSRRSPEAQVANAIEDLQRDVARFLKRASCTTPLNAMHRDLGDLTRDVTRVRQLAHHANLDRRTRSAMNAMVRDFQRMEDTFDRVVAVANRRGHDRDNRVPVRHLRDLNSHGPVAHIH